MATNARAARALLEIAGHTAASQAGIRLANTPAALYRLLVLCVLVSARIKTDIAVDAARELVAAGFGTPRGMRDAGWRQRVEALDRARYVRYDESTATALGEGAQQLLDEYGGDLRRLRDRAGGDAGELRTLLRELPRLGPVGAEIFCREAQQVWPELRPYFDRKAIDGARRLNLPADRSSLAKLVAEDDLARFAAGLVRAGMDNRVADRVRAA